MKQTRYHFRADMPYSLHDMCVTKIKRKGKDLKLSFADGYEQRETPYRKVQGEIWIQDVDFDFADVHILSKWGKFDNFRGKKLTLKKFLRKYKTFSFEIADEMYGYNRVTYVGYLSLPKKKTLREFELSVYHFGDIIYATKEKDESEEIHAESNMPDKGH